MLRADVQLIDPIWTVVPADIIMRKFFRATVFHPANFTVLFVSLLWRLTLFLHWYFLVVLILLEFPDLCSQIPRYSTSVAITGFHPVANFATQ